jgi:hypothetical protein
MPTGFDWNSQYRMPPGWTTLPDGSVGPSSDVPDWLKQLIPSPGASIPNAPGTPTGGAGPEGLMPGGGLMGYQAATPGAPSMGFPAQGGPQVMPPQYSTLPPNKSVGPFTGGTSTEGSYYDPRTWFRGGQTFTPGQPMGPDVTGGGGASPLSYLAKGSPAWRAAMAAAGVMSPTPADTGELPLSLSGARPMHPSSTGAMPNPATYPHMPWPGSPPAPQGGGVGSDANFPVMGAGGFPTTYAAPGRQPASVTMANAPPGSPSETPRPGLTNAPMPPRRPKNLSGASPASQAAPVGNSRFGTFQYQVPGGGGPLSRSPIYTALNLFGGKS